MGLPFGRMAGGTSLREIIVHRAFGLDIPQTLEDVCDPTRLALVVYDVTSVSEVKPWFLRDAPGFHLIINGPSRTALCECKSYRSSLTAHERVASCLVPNQSVRL
jgi:hypothetical protein